MNRAVIVLKTHAPMAKKYVLTLFLGYAIVVAMAYLEYGYCGARTTPLTQPAVFSRYGNLLKDPKATRENWQKVISGLLKIHEKGQREQAPRALLFAGRGALVLYDKSHKREDLDNAVELLNILVRQYEKSPYFIDGLKELKRAHELKLRLLQKASLSPSVPLPKQVNKGPADLSERLPGPDQERVAEIARLASPQTAQEQRAGHQQAAQSPLPLRTNRVGNPYYDGISSDLTKERASTAVAFHRHIDAPITRGGVTPAGVGVPPANEKKNRPFVIVVDPGHGGRDPGAVSPDGTMKEKDFTLDLCLRIQKRLLELLPDAQVKLTRTEDANLALVERAEIANCLDADLFMSIHGNAYPDSRAGGVETFYLSAANSRGAMRVAARENGISLAKMTDLQATVVDLVVRGKKEESEFLAHEVHNSLISTIKSRGHSTRDRGVKTAPFYVLLGAKMPAILVECVFLTSVNDRRNLLAENKLNDIADGIAMGTMNYIVHNRDKTGSPSLTTSLDSRGAS